MVGWPFMTSTLAKPGELGPRRGGDFGGDHRATATGLLPPTRLEPYACGDAWIKSGKWSETLSLERPLKRRFSRLTANGLLT